MYFPAHHECAHTHSFMPEFQNSMGVVALMLYSMQDNYAAFGKGMGDSTPTPQCMLGFRSKQYVSAHTHGIQQVKFPKLQASSHPQHTAWHTTTSLFTYFLMY